MITHQRTLQKMYEPSQLEKDFYEIRAWGDWFIYEENKWTPLPAHLGLSSYEVTRNGKLRNVKTGYVARDALQDKYIINGLTHDDGTSFGWRRHQLIAQTFVPNPDNAPQVDHIDRDPTNNHFTNLRWVTQWENNMNRTFRRENTNEREVDQISPDGVLIKHWKSIKLIVSESGIEGITERAVYMACRVGGKSHGFIWKFADIDKKLDLPDEVWKPVEHNGVVIRASSLGRIRGPSGVPTYGFLNGKYMQVVVGGKTTKSHKMVCIAFHGPKPSSGHTVDHINKIPDDNRECNLRWATKEVQSENRKPMPNELKRCRPVIKSYNGHEVEFPSIKAAALSVLSDPKKLDSVMTIIGTICRANMRGNNTRKSLYLECDWNFAGVEKIINTDSIALGDAELD